MKIISIILTAAVIFSISSDAVCIEASNNTSVSKGKLSRKSNIETTNTLNSADKSSSSENQLHKQTLSELNSILKQQEYVLKDFEVAKRYFPGYWVSDLGKAKTMYLYLYAELLRSEDSLDRADILFAEGFTGNDEYGASRIFNLIVDNVIKMKADFTTIEEKLEIKVFPLDKIKQNAGLIDIDQPVYEIIYGRLDSDRDGVPDHIELQDNNADINRLITGIITITKGSGFDFDSGRRTIFTGSSLKREVLYAVYGLNEGLQGCFYVNMDDKKTVPLSGYSSDKVLKTLNTGSRWAMKYPGNYYIVFDIKSHNPSKSITIQYWYNREGGVFTIP
ncbi:MAG: hypothetical protein GY730_08940 [bacterium]|nr:hypothetical protein [bacterium]